MYGWLWDCCITSSGLELRLFKVLPIYWLSGHNIVGVHIVRGWLGGFQLGSHPWNTVALGNRLRWTWVLVEKGWWPRFLAITPDDPETFIREVGRLPGS
jgi:hypothetical protein